MRINSVRIFFLYIRRDKFWLTKTHNKHFLEHTIQVPFCYLNGTNHTIRSLITCNSVGYLNLWSIKCSAHLKFNEEEKDEKEEERMNDWLTEWMNENTCTCFSLKCVYKLTEKVNVKKKKTSSFKHAAWSKDSILCFWRDTIFCAICSTLKAARTCCAVNVLTSRISFLFSWPWWMRCLVKHNMLKNISNLIAIKYKISLNISN